MITSKVTIRGQTTLPRQIRDALAIQPGQSLVYEPQGDYVILRVHPGALASFGALQGKPPGTDFAAARADAREAWADHAGTEGTCP